MSSDYVKTKSVEHSELSEYVSALLSSDHHNPFIVIRYKTSETELWMGIRDGEIEAYFKKLSDLPEEQVDLLKALSTGHDLNMREIKNNDWCLHWDFKGTPEVISEKIRVLMSKGFGMNDSENIELTYYQLDL